MKLTAIPCTEEKLYKDFQYPLESWKSGEGMWEVHDKMSLLAHVDNNPLFDIAEVYHVECSSDEYGSDWILLGKSTAGYFVYIKAGCDFTGFSCQGSGEIALELSWEHLWDNVMDNDARQAVSRTQGWESFQLKA